MSHRSSLYARASCPFMLPLLLFNASLMNNKEPFSIPQQLMQTNARRMYFSSITCPRLYGGSLRECSVVFLCFPFRLPSGCSNNRYCSTASTRSQVQWDIADGWVFRPRLVEVWGILSRRYLASALFNFAFVLDAGSSREAVVNSLH